MNDVKTIMEDSEAFDRAMERRGAKSDLAAIMEFTVKRNSFTTELQEMQTRRNVASRAIGEGKREGQDATALITEVSELKPQIQKLEKDIEELSETIEEYLWGLPNALDLDVPDGTDEADNVEIRRAGTLPSFTFPPKDHVALGEALGGIDFATAAKMSGARFVVLRGMLSRLERALTNFMLDHHANHGYTEISPPLMVREKALYGTGQMPKFNAQQFRVRKSDDRDIEISFDKDMWLIPTAEVPLTNLVRETILDEEELPIRVTAATPCFRSEAGASGKDTRGMIRLHQFNKVEMVSITHPDDSKDEHERMTKCAEDILTRLGLPFRTVILCAGDTGFSAAKTYDIEVWLPGQDGGGRYREISSCSNCRDFQARRMKARFRRKGVKGTEFVHTLNGSGLAVGRTLIAVLENYQQKDGSIAVPEALQPYMDGLELIPAPMPALASALAKSAAKSVLKFPPKPQD